MCQWIVLYARRNIGYFRLRALLREQNYSACTEQCDAHYDTGYERAEL